MGKGSKARLSTVPVICICHQTSTERWDATGEAQMSRWQSHCGQIKVWYNQWNFRNISTLQHVKPGKVKPLVTHYIIVYPVVWFVMFSVSLVTVLSRYLLSIACPIYASFVQLGASICRLRRSGFSAMRTCAQVVKGAKQSGSTEFDISNSFWGLKNEFFPQIWSFCYHQAAIPWGCNHPCSNLLISRCCQIQSLQAESTERTELWRWERPKNGGFFWCSDISRTQRKLFRKDLMHIAVRWVCLCRFHQKWRFRKKSVIYFPHLRLEATVVCL